MPYELLQEKGKIIKTNFENRMDIAKLSVVAAKLSLVERKQIAEAVRSGRLTGDLEITSIVEEDRKKLGCFMNRCGVSCKIIGTVIKPSEEKIDEVRVDLPNRVVWVNSESNKLLNENLDQMKGITVKIQLQNAVRQIKTFDDKEEKEFVELQQQYLDLLKKQDEILKDFYEEEKMSVKV
ncbi:hypothetical protein HZC07_03165 [Candidatus Micrarchaeota archaeon]|nr:hypothetical protein [Candidatus Micrarchaeota archaeon]